MMKSMPSTPDLKPLDLTVNIKTVGYEPVDEDDKNAVYFSYEDSVRADHRLSELRNYFPKNYAQAQSFRMNELEGVDLRGKLVYVWYRDWEDSTWLSTDTAITVEQCPIEESDDPRYPDYKFVFPKNENAPAEKAEAVEADDDEDFDDEDYVAPWTIEGARFWGSEDVYVVTLKNEVN
jgi:hypothetical protein